MFHAPLQIKIFKDILKITILKHTQISNPSFHISLPSLLTIIISHLLLKEKKKKCQKKFEHSGIDRHPNDRSISMTLILS